MDSSHDEPAVVNAFRLWFLSRGGSFHADVRHVKVESGYAILARKLLPADTIVVSCPFSLIITPTVCREALSKVLGGASVLEGWSERQLLCCYICFHWIIDDAGGSFIITAHKPYIDILPNPSMLRTPLHFLEAELDLVNGTNLYGATLERKSAWLQEWERCQKDVSEVRPMYAEELTWERYLTASTYVSSRAFPSTLLSSPPSLVQTPDSYPILLPGVDSLNHARAHPVSWVVSSPSDPISLSISLQPHTQIASGEEVFNNYGPKPNAELLLGYGFTLPKNPDDTMVLKIGGDGHRRWEVGLEARGVEGLWVELLTALSTQDEINGHFKWETMLDAAGALQSMLETLEARLPKLDVSAEGVRGDVARMIENYVAGQKAILGGLIAFSREREVEAIALAQKEGVEIHLE
ncbi:hypothetical protein K488DRAFT_78949 [Vararia minispora EC-137]|uniref:Uncharacterized protein n=1 Tax=Vararia minispora EC-137 TaxID=1314806 RepID=A0ACB8QIL0_9AGAM|nr:hypothetical protein K488DRAFT_78949 [Vararia minispora EC-137]